LQFQGGLLQAPLNPLKTDVSRGPPGLSGGSGPFGPHRNSTTGNRQIYKHHHHHIRLIMDVRRSHKVSSKSSRPKIVPKYSTQYSYNS